VASARNAREPDDGKRQSAYYELAGTHKAIDMRMPSRRRQAAEQDIDLLGRVALSRNRLLSACLPGRGESGWARPAETDKTEQTCPQPKRKGTGDGGGNVMKNRESRSGDKQATNVGVVPDGPRPPRRPQVEGQRGTGRRGVMPRHQPTEGFGNWSPNETAQHRRRWHARGQPAGATQATQFCRACRRSSHGDAGRPTIRRNRRCTVKRGDELLKIGISRGSTSCLTSARRWW